MNVWLRRREKLDGRRIQPVQRADAAIGDSHDGALQAETETSAGGGSTGWTRDCR